MKINQLFTKSILLASLLFSVVVAQAETALSSATEPAVVEASPALTTNQPDVNQPLAAEPTSIQPTSIQPASTQPAPVTPFYQNANNATSPIGSGGHLLNVTLGLMAIIGLIFALSWFVKRFTQGAISGNSHIKMLSAMPLGTRERIVLIEVGNEQLLLGVTASTVNTLHVLSSPIVVADKKDITSEFSKKLMAILQQKNTAESAVDHKATSADNNSQNNNSQNNNAQNNNTAG